jgi:spore maturation protein CgeB
VTATDLEPRASRASPTAVELSVDGQIQTIQMKAAHASRHAVRWSGTREGVQFEFLPDGSGYLVEAANSSNFKSRHVTRAIQVAGAKALAIEAVTKGSDLKAAALSLIKVYCDEAGEVIARRASSITEDMVFQIEQVPPGTHSVAIALKLTGKGCLGDVRISVERVGEDAAGAVTAFGRESPPSIPRERRSVGAPRTTGTTGPRKEAWKSVLEHVLSHPGRMLPPSHAFKALSILDNFSHTCFSPEIDLVQAQPEHWLEQIETTQPFAVFAESAWQGNEGAWRLAMSKFAQKGESLRELIAECRRRAIKTVFWNKEDPAHFDTFLPVAACFDFIFTTDSGCIPRYREALGHSNVFALPFAAQPRHHNPIGQKRHFIPRVAFAGSWRGEKYESRANWLEVLLDPAVELAVLDIFDRFANSEDESLQFPAFYQPAVRGTLPFEALSILYKHYAGFLNVNTIQESPTMFSRRVFEILASGTPVISSPSVGMERMLGEVVLTPTSKADVRDAILCVTGDKPFRDRLGARGVRIVMQSHTYARRVAAMAEIIGAPPVIQRRKRVAVVCVSRRPDFIARAFENFTRQTYADKQFFFVMHSEQFDMADVEAFTRKSPGTQLLRIPPDAKLGDGLNAALEQADSDFFAKMDDDDYYTHHYLADSMLAFEYTDAGLVGKNSYFCYLEALDVLAVRFPNKELTYTKRVCGATLLGNRRAVGSIRFGSFDRGTDTDFVDKCLKAGCRIYSTSRFNFIAHRRADVSTHTWTLDAREFLSNCDVVRKGLDLDFVTA